MFVEACPDVFASGSCHRFPHERTIVRAISRSHTPRKPLMLRPRPLRASTFLLCVMSMGLMLPRSTSAQAFNLAVRLDFTAGTGPAGIAIGDLNGDGRPDLVVANDNANTVSVLLGNATFGAKTDFATGSLPISVAIGDLNGDG